MSLLQMAGRGQCPSGVFPPRCSPVTALATPSAPVSRSASWRASRVLAKRLLGGVCLKQRGPQRECVLVAPAYYRTCPHRSYLRVSGFDDSASAASPKAAGVWPVAALCRAVTALQNGFAFPELSAEGTRAAHDAARLPRHGVFFPGLHTYFEKIFLLSGELVRSPVLVLSCVCRWDAWLFPLEMTGAPRAASGSNTHDVLHVVSTVTHFLVVISRESHAECRTGP